MTRARWSWKQKLLLQALLAPLALLVLECGLRAYQFARGTPYRSETARSEILGVLDAFTTPLPRAPEDRQEGLSNIKDAYVLHPYYGFTTLEELEDTSRLTQLFHEGVDPDTYVVMLLGGSVAGLLGGYLREGLEADPRLKGRSVLLVSLGRGANRQPQQLVRALFMQGLNVVPDVIVNVDGFNEAAFGRNNVQKQVHPLYPYWPRWAHLALTTGPDAEGLSLAAEVIEGQERALACGRRALEGPWLRSALAGSWMLRRVHALGREWVAAQERYEVHLAQMEENATARGPEFPGDLEVAMEAVVRMWLECSLALGAYCEARGIGYLHVLQPTLYDEGSKPLTPVEVGRGRHALSYRQGVLACYPRMRAAAPGLAAAGIQFLDATMLFEDVEAEIYTDYCHLNELGNELLASMVLNELLGPDFRPPAAHGGGGTSRW